MSSQTLVDLYRNLENLKKPDLLLVKKAGAWTPISSDEFCQRIRWISAALGAMGVEPGGRVALLSENRPEWSLVDFACQCYGAVLVPVFPTMVSEQTEYLLRDSGATVAFCSTADQTRKVLDAKKSAPALKHVVAFDDVSGVRSFGDVLEEGRKAHEADETAFSRRADQRKPDDLATLIYTSGTTGEPKGAMLTQKNFVSNVTGGLQVLPLSSNDVALSFLPLSHVFERMLEYCYYTKGVTIAFAESFEKISANLQEVNPTCFAAVPRVYEKVYSKIQDKFSKAPAGKQKLVAKALAVGREVYELRAKRKTPGMFLAAQHFVFDKLVFSKIRAALGSRFRYAVSGGAPLERKLAEFFWSVGIEIYEGYGLTETSPVITVNGPGAWRLGSVGRAIAGVEVRIAEDGEILSRGPHIMKGYWQKPEATKEAIDAEGWFHTGDIGVVDEDGFLKITDRKKEIIVNSNGKNIAPAPIENHLKTHAFVSQVVVIGDKRKFLSCLIVPDFEKLGDWAKGAGLSGKEAKDLVADPKVREIYQGAVDEWNKGGRSHEQQIGRFALLPAELTIEGGELTPKLSVKRRVVDAKYKDVIDGMYAGGGD